MLMSDICISYRRADSQAITGRIFDRLTAYYGKEAIFIDIDNIPVGTDFRQHLAKTLRRATVLLAIVGPRWLGAGKGGPDRIHEESDPVRVELETALRNGLAIIPVLIGNRKMPTATQVPASLKEFVFINAVTVDPGVDFDHHIQRLISHIDTILAAKGRAIGRAAESVAARRIGTTERPDRTSQSDHSRAGRAGTDSRERRIAAGKEASEKAERFRQPSGGAVSTPERASLLSRLPSRMRIPIFAGAAVLCFALLMLAFLAWNGSDKSPTSLMAAPRAEVPAKTGGRKCSVDGFSLDLRNCR
jgi:TIR domain